MTKAYPQEGGFALVTALWAALILALISSYLISATRTDARIERTLRRQLQQHALAEGIINLIELRLFGPHSNSLPFDGAPFAVEYEGVSAEVRMQDQAGLIDLNFATPGILTRLMMVAGNLDAMATQTLVDQILDWRGNGIGRRLNGAKASDYADAGFAYGPRQGPFETVGELRLLMGMTSDIYARVCRLLTVYAQTPNINLQVAPQPVLEIIPGMDAAMVAEIMAQRARRDGVGSAFSSMENASTRVVAISVALRGKSNIKIRVDTIVRVMSDHNSLIWTYVPAE